MNVIKKIIVLQLTMGLVVSCTSSDTKTVTTQGRTNSQLAKSMNYQYSQNFFNDSLRKNKLAKAMEEGDTLSYTSISKDFALGGGEDEFMYHSLIAAAKYNYPAAYFDAYLYFDRLRKEDKMFNILADYYLINGYTRGDKSSALEVKVRFGENVDSNRLTNYLKKIEGALYRGDIKY